VTERLRQPRHDYLLLTRRAALALLHLDIDGGDRLSAEAERLGKSVGDSDAGNVRMSQLLEVVRARGDTAALRHTAALAVSGGWVFPLTRTRWQPGSWRAPGTSMVLGGSSTLCCRSRTGPPNARTCGRFSAASSLRRPSPSPIIRCVSGSSMT